MTEIEKKRLEVQLAGVSAARMEQELKKMELLANIQRLDDAIKIQLDKEKELQAKLKGE